MKQYIIIFIFFFAFHLLIRIDTLGLPIYDWHNFRQSVTYSSIYLLSTHQADFLHPKFFHSVNPENTNHYFFGEAPIYQFLVALLFNLFGENVMLARMVNIVLIAVASVAITVFAQKTIDSKISFIPGLLLGFFPSTYYWARSITPDILALTAFSLSAATLVIKPKRILLASVLLAIAVLIKPFYFAFVIFHASLSFSSNQSYKKTFIELVTLYSVPIVTSILWALWKLQFPLYERDDPKIIEILHNGIGYNAFFHQYRWMVTFLQRDFFGLLLTPLGAVLSISGLVLMLQSNSNKIKNIIVALCASSFLITIVVAKGSYHHDYYLLHWTFVCSLLVWISLKSLWKSLYDLYRKNSSPVSSKSLVFPLAIAFAIFIAYFLGIEPFLFHKRDYLQNRAMYSPAFLRDYQKIRNLVPVTESVLVVLPEYTPYPLTMIRRFGFIVVPSCMTDCTFEKIANTLIQFKQKNVTYLLIDQSLFKQDESFESIIGTAKISPSRIMNGERFALYAL